MAGRGFDTHNSKLKTHNFATGATMYELEKQNAARGALQFVKNGMVVGLGTGSTAAEFIRLLAGEIKRGLSIRCVATSIASQKLAESLGIKILNLGEVDRIDIAVDGADVATKTALLKGGGGALTREKVIDYEAKKFIVITDESKVKKSLEGVVVVEALSFASPILLSKLKTISPATVLRLDKNEPVVTDNGNWLIDCPMLVKNPKKTERELKALPGVVENGIFTKFDRILIGTKNGHRVFD